MKYLLFPAIVLLMSCDVSFGWRSCESAHISFNQRSKCTAAQRAECIDCDSNNECLNIRCVSRRALICEESDAGDAHIGDAGDAAVCGSDDAGLVDAAVNTDVE